jgi:hypothetical protein
MPACSLFAGVCLAYFRGGKIELLSTQIIFGTQAELLLLQCLLGRRNTDSVLFSFPGFNLIFLVYIGITTVAMSLFQCFRPRLQHLVPLNGKCGWRLGGGGRVSFHAWHGRGASRGRRAARLCPATQAGPGPRDSQFIELHNGQRWTPIRSTLGISKLADAAIGWRVPGTVHDQRQLHSSIEAVRVQERRRQQLVPAGRHAGGHYARRADQPHRDRDVVERGARPAST